MARNNNNRNNTRRKDEITCVQLSKETKNKLADLGKKSDTFEKIILSLLDRPESCGKNMVGENESE